MQGLVYTGLAGLPKDESVEEARARGAHVYVLGRGLGEAVAGLATDDLRRVQA